MAIETIKNISLHNKGGFVAKIQIGYVTEDMKRVLLDKKSADITLGKTLTVNIGDYNITEGQMCFMRAFVVAGTDRDTEESFIYSQKSDATAHYTISGTTLGPHLNFDGVNS